MRSNLIRVMIVQPTIELDKDAWSMLHQSYSLLAENKCEGDAGLDIVMPKSASTSDVRSTPAFMLVPTYCRILVVEGHQGQPLEYYTPISWMFVPRSSTFKKTKAILANSVGIIDAGYRGEVKAAMLSFHQECSIFERLERYFQVVPFDGKGINAIVLYTKDEIDLEKQYPSVRGSGGHGSTDDASHTLVASSKPQPPKEEEL